MGVGCGHKATKRDLSKGAECVDTAVQMLVLLKKRRGGGVEGESSAGYNCERENMRDTFPSAAKTCF